MPAESLQELREHRSVLAKQINDIMDKTDSGGWGEEQQKIYDNNMDGIREIDSKIKRIEEVRVMMEEEAEVDAISKTYKDKVKKKTPATEMFHRWAVGGDKALTAEEWAGIQATMSTTTPAEGGYTVQDEVLSRIIDSLKAYTGLREAAGQISTAMGNPMNFPSSDGTTEEGEIIAENQTATALDPTFGTVPLAAYKWSSKVVAVPFELLQDSEVDVEGFITGRCTQRIGRIQNRLMTVGSGTNQPFGIVTRSSEGKVGATGQTLTVTFDDLSDLKRSVNRAYRSAPGVGWMMSDTSMGVVEKLKDSQGRPIFLPGYDGLGAAAQDRILGDVVTINDDVPAMAANAKSILYGDMKQYMVRDVMSIQLFRFTDSAYIKLGQIGFLMWARAGGNLLDTNAVKYYQNSAT